PLPPPPPEDDLVFFPLDDAYLATLPLEERAAIEDAVRQHAAGTLHTVPHEVVEAMMAERRRRHRVCATCDGEGELDGQECAACEGSGDFCTTCGKSWRACIGANACEPPAAPWAAQRSHTA